METKIYSCAICSGGPFKKKKDLYAHKSVVHGEKRHTCTTCQKAFVHLSKLQRHETVHHDKCCDICHESFSNYALLRKHQLHNHAEKSACPHCNKEFKMKHSLKVHSANCWMAKVNLPMPHNGGAAMLSEAMSIETPGSSTTFMDITTKSSDGTLTETTKSSIRSHPYSPTGLSDFAVEHSFYFCDSCQAGPFLKKKQLFRHCRETHGNKRYICSVTLCEKAFDCQSRLTRHLKMHHGRKCDQCGQDFSNYTLYRRHKASCQQSASSKVPLPLPPPFQCQFPNCTKTYTSKRNLNHHVRVRHENVRFHCTSQGCTAKLTSKQKLNLHLKAKHGEETTSGLGGGSSTAASTTI